MTHAKLQLQGPIIIYGKTGQVASALAELLQDKAIVFASFEHDFSDIENIRAALKNISAKAIINATAYTDVNKAESEEDAAFKANALIPETLAKYCLEKNIPLIHYSTDYVFPGVGDKPYKESEPTSPLNAYGRTKLAGEEKIKAVGGKYLIFRTSWVYDSSRKNFFVTMIKLGAERETLSIVSDQFGAPTYAPHLAEATLGILEQLSFPRRRESTTLPERESEKNIISKIACGVMDPRLRGDDKFPSGIYHLCNNGETSWHGFAKAIFDEARANNIPLKVQEVKPISSSEFPTPAKRPHNSRLNCSLASETFGIKMPTWQDGLKACIKQFLRNK